MGSKWDLLDVLPRLIRSLHIALDNLHACQLTLRHVALQMIDGRLLQLDIVTHWHGKEMIGPGPGYHFARGSNMERIVEYLSGSETRSICIVVACAWLLVSCPLQIGRIGEVAPSAVGASPPRANPPI